MKVQGMADGEPSLVNTGGEGAAAGAGERVVSSDQVQGGGH